MRRLISSALAAAVLVAFSGCLCGPCSHVAGVCDCACPGDPCCYGHGPGNPIDPCHGEHGVHGYVGHGAEYHAAPAIQAVPAAVPAAAN